MTLPAWIIEIEKRAEEATPGPWVTRNKSPGEFSTPSIEKSGGGILANTTHYYPMEADAVLMAASRTDIPKLVAALKDVLEALAKAHEELVGEIGHEGGDLMAALKACDSALVRIEGME